MFLLYINMMGMYVWMQKVCTGHSTHVEVRGQLQAIITFTLFEKGLCSVCQDNWPMNFQRFSCLCSLGLQMHELHDLPFHGFWALNLGPLAAWETL